MFYNKITRLQLASSVCVEVGTAQPKPVVGASLGFKRENIFLFFKILRANDGHTKIIGEIRFEYCCKYRYPQENS